MNRTIAAYLNDWRNSTRRKPLLLRGARQVGKTWSVRDLANKIIPIEVKAGTKGKMQSLRLFLASHQSPYGIRTSLENGGEYDDIKVIPACSLFNIYK